MKSLFKRLLVGLLIFSMANLPISAYAQRDPYFNPRQLEQDLAPVALYPDGLLSQILMAATYPLEIEDADRWLRNPNNSRLRGDQLAYALDQEDWDPSVKSLVPFPQIVRMMTSRPDWTQRLGDAFLDQEEDVMDAVQRLRQQAYNAGQLRTTPQQVVDYGPTIVIRPARPDVVYVPVYDPRYAYGSWAYPDYPPVYIPPPPGYYAGPSLATGLAFAAGVGIVASLWGWNDWDWGRRRIVVNRDRYILLNRNRQPIFDDHWRHDSYHRRGVEYFAPLSRERYDRGDFGRFDQRRDRRFDDAARRFEQRNREIERNRERDIARERAQLRDIERQREQQRSREFERNRQREQQQERERNREQERDRSREFERNRQREQQQERERNREQERDRSRDRFQQNRQDNDRFPRSNFGDNNRDQNDGFRNREFQQQQERDQERNRERDRQQQQQFQRQQQQQQEQERRAQREQQQQQQQFQRQQQQQQEQERRAQREQQQQQQQFQRQQQQQQQQQQEQERRAQRQIQQQQQQQQEQERRSQRQNQQQQQQIQQQQQQRERANSQNNQRNNDDNNRRNRDRDRDRDRN